MSLFGFYFLFPLKKKSQTHIFSPETTHLLWIKGYFRDSEAALNRKKMNQHEGTLDFFTMTTVSGGKYIYYCGLYGGFLFFCRPTVGTTEGAAVILQVNAIRERHTQTWDVIRTETGLPLEVIRTTLNSDLGPNKALQKKKQARLWSCTKSLVLFVGLYYLCLMAPLTAPALEPKIWCQSYWCKTPQKTCIQLF